MHTIFDDVSVSAPPLRRASLVAVCITLLLLLSTAVWFVAHQFVGEFERIEIDSESRKAHQIYRAFEGDLQQLEISNRDYAEWDDAEHFVRAPAPAFLQGNFSATTLQGMFVNVVWIVDASGKELYSALLDPDTAALTSPAPPPILDQFRQFMTTDPGLRDLSPARRVVRTSEGLAAVSAIEIARSDLSRATGAVMLFARFIRRDVVERIQKTSELPATLLPLSGGGSGAPTLPAPVASWLRSGPADGATSVFVPDETTIHSYALVSDLQGRPVALFHTQSARSIYGLGHRITWQLLSAIVGLFLVSGAAFVVMILRLRRSLIARQGAHQRYRNITAQLQEFLVLVDADTKRIVATNDVVLRALGTDRERLRSKGVKDVFPDIPPTIVDAVAGGSPREVCESRMLREDGGVFDTEIVIAKIDDDGRAFLSLTARDITHRREAEELQRVNRRRLAQLANRDALTGLPNRLFLQTRLPRVLKRTARTDRILGVMYLDIDHFKKINDSRGHGCGDQLLRVIASRLRASVSQADVVVRMGGDEFVIVLSLMPDTRAINDVAERLQLAVQAPIVLEDTPLTVSASMGIAVYPQDGMDMDSLLKFADIALYQAKEGGRRCHRFFTAEMDVRVSEQVAIEQALRHAIGSDQLYLEYQPIMDLSTGFLASMEALMRWRHPELGLIPPGRFIPVAESSGLIESIGEIAIRKTIQQLSQWNAEGVPIVPIAVNVATVQLERSDFPEMVARIASEAGVDMRFLRFEITESAMVKNADRLIGTLQALRALGSQILVDDFGTGYSNLSHLARLPVDTLKIDRAFVNGMETDAARASIVRSVIGMARELKLSTTAEGVETSAQLSMLSELGCTYGQGYYYSRPIAARDCTLLLGFLNRERNLAESPPAQRRRGTRY